MKELLLLHHHMTVIRILLCHDFISPPCPQQFLTVFQSVKKKGHGGRISEPLPAHLLSANLLAGNNE